MHRFVGQLVVAALLLVAAAGSAAGVEIQEIRWGFDGKAVPGRINLVSIKVYNPFAEPFGGQFTLYKNAGAGGRYGAYLVADGYVSPYSSRWLQFYPHVNQNYETWTLSWGRSPLEKTELPQVTHGPLQRVLLTEENELLGGRFPLKRFPTALFPATVAATDALQSAVLDHVPRWEATRRQAFLDWLYRGGTLHLLQTPHGNFPEFAGDLAELNEADGPVGMGRVVRHAAPRKAVDLAALTAAGDPPLELVTNNDSRLYQLEETLFNVLKSLTRTDHNWTMIYLMVAIYLLLIGPANYFLARKRHGYAVPLVFFFVTVVGFASIFTVAGRRGYGEETIVHSLAYARPLPDAHYDVTRWTHAFVTRSQDYVFTHNGAANLYSTCQNMEAVNGRIVGGKNGQFVVDMPLFSSRSFLYRGKLRGPEMSFVVEPRAADSQVPIGPIRIAGDFPQTVDALWIVYLGDVYTGERSEDRVVVRAAGVESLQAFLTQEVSEAVQVANTLRWRRRQTEEGEEPPTVASISREMIGPVMAYGLGGAGALRQDVAPYRPASATLDLFVLAAQPAEFEMDAAEFGRQVGQTLYHYRLPVKPNE